MANELLEIGSRIFALPIVHGSGDFAVEVRRVMLSREFDCVAVPLPPSFQNDVEWAITQLPTPMLVVQHEPGALYSEWTPDADENETPPTLSYVPIDPCQAVIAAIRTAMGEHIPREFIDLETARFEPYSRMMPDPYALKRVSLDRFAAAMLTCVPRPKSIQRLERISYMAQRLVQLQSQCESILLVCSVLDWPWIRESFVDQNRVAPQHEAVEGTTCFEMEPNTLQFAFGELPFITGLYERARSELDDDENLSIDGVKELLLAARDAYRIDLKQRARNITPHLLARCLMYIRNLSLIERRFTPDLFSIVIAAKQVLGDQFARHVAETSRQYPFEQPSGLEQVRMGIDQAQLPDGEIVKVVSRLPGPPVQWRRLQLQRRPDRSEMDEWRMRWNPFSHCSWPPEDDSIENFRSHVFDRARAVLGADMARTEKFTTSIKDGIDIRDTLRHWYDGDIYVKVLPPDRGQLDCAVMLFDSPADPREYPWRTTWYAEHEEESTLAFFATDFRQEPVGPGICLASYGGALFLFPPVPIADIWTDDRLDFAETLEERVLAAACVYSQCPHIVLVSRLPPGAGWRRLAKRFRKKWIHLPLGQFSDSTVAQLRMVHVLNGKNVRSYAAQFIRRP